VNPSVHVNQNSSSFLLKKILDIAIKKSYRSTSGLIYGILEKQKKQRKNLSKKFFFPFSVMQETRKKWYS